MEGLLTGSALCPEPLSFQGQDPKVPHVTSASIPLARPLSHDHTSCRGKSRCPKLKVQFCDSNTVVLKVQSLDHKQQHLVGRGKWGCEMPEPEAISGEGESSVWR